MKKTNQQLIIFVRYPHLGTVKSRMTYPDYSPSPLQAYQALELYRSFLKDVIPRFCHQSHFDCLIMLGGANDNDKQQFLKTFDLPDYQAEFMPDHTSDLGELMELCFEKSLQTYQRAVIIGSDAPQLTVFQIQEAFESLNNYDVVIGPDHGGGMYLIGYASPWGLMKEGIVWGKGTDCQAMVERIHTHQKALKLLPIEIDLDTTTDLQLWYKAYGKRISTLPISDRSHHTFQYIQKHIQTSIK